MRPRSSLIRRKDFEQRTIDYHEHLPRGSTRPPRETEQQNCTPLGSTKLFISVVCGRCDREAPGFGHPARSPGTGAKGHGETAGIPTHMHTCVTHTCASMPKSTMLFGLFGRLSTCAITSSVHMENSFFANIGTCCCVCKSAAQGRGNRQDRSGTPLGEVVQGEKWPSDKHA